MKKFIPALAVILAFVLLSVLPGCGNNEKPAEESAADQMTEDNTNNSDTQPNADATYEQREPVPPVDFKKLTVYVPSEVEGMQAQNPEGETLTMGEWSYSHAKSEYSSSDGEKSASIDVIDYAYINALYAPYQALFSMQYNRESTTGYEKSTTVNGYPAFEKWNNDGGSGDITVLVGKRFLVVIHTSGMSQGSAKKIAEGLNLSSLANETAG